METINKDSLLPLLKTSELANLIVNQDNEIVIPKNYILNNFETIITYKLIINSDSDFDKTLNKLRYWMVNEIPYEMLDYAYKNRHSVKYTIDHYKDFFYKELKALVNTKDKNINSIIETGSLYFLKYALGRGFRWNNESCACAAKSGNVECLKLLRVDGCPWGDHTIRNAAKYGNLECIKYALMTGCSFRTAKDRMFDMPNPCEIAYKYNNYDCMKYLYDKGCSFYEKSINDTPYSYIKEQLDRFFGTQKGTFEDSLFETSKYRLKMRRLR